MSGAGDIPGCFWGGRFQPRADDAAVITAAGGTPVANTEPDYQDKNALLRAELLAGRTMGVVRVYRSFDDLFPYSGAVGPDGDPHDLEQWAMDGGRRVVLSFASGFFDHTYIPFADVDEGTYDSILNNQADNVAVFMADRDEIAICPTHEPDMAYSTQIEANGAQGAGSAAITVDPATVRFALPAGTVVQFTGWASSRTLASPIAPGAVSLPLSAVSPNNTADGAKTVGQTVAQMRASYQSMFKRIRDHYEARWDSTHPTFDQSKVKWATIFIGNDAFWGDPSGATALYPGNSYVDYAGADVYNGMGTLTMGGQWKSFLAASQAYLNWARSLGKTGQYMLIGETGLIEGSPVVPTGPFGPSVGPITINVAPLHSIIPAGWIVDFFNGVTAVVAAPGAQGDVTIDLVSLPGIVNASTPGAANTIVGRKPLWIFPEATTDIQVSAPEVRYWCYFTGGSEHWWVETPYEGSDASALAWAAMGAEPYFANVEDTAPADIPMLLRCLADDETTVLLDVTELNQGAEFGFGIPPDGFDLGGGELEDEYVDDMAYDGGAPAGSYRPRTAMRFQLLLFASSADDMRARMRLLNELLDQPHKWEYRPQGATTSLLIDGFRSPAAKLLDGGVGELRYVMNDHFGEPKIELYRQPALRMGRRLGVIRRTITNAPGGNYVQLTNPGNCRSRICVYVQPAHSEIAMVGFRMARKSFGNLTEAAASFLGFQADTADFPTGSTTTGHGTHADTEDIAGTGFVAITTYANAALLSRLKQIFEPVDPSALEGAQLVGIAVSCDPGAIYTFQVRSGLTSPLSSVGDVIPIDLTDEGLVAAGDRVVFFLWLGLIQYNGDFGSTFVVEIASSCDTPGVGLETHFGDVKFLPASESIVSAYEPTYRGLTTGQMVWDPPTQFMVCADINLPSTNAVDGAAANSIGGELDVTDAGQVRLGRADVVGTGDHPDRTDEGVGTVPNEGIALQPGVYTAKLTVWTHDKDKAAKTLAELRVRQINEANVTLRDKAVTKIKHPAGVTDNTQDWLATFVVDNVAQRWQIQCVYTIDRKPTVDAVTRKAHPLACQLSFVRTMGIPEMAVLDGFAERAYGRVARGKTHDLVPSGVPEAEAGIQLLVFHMDEAPVAGTENADARGPLPSYSATRKYKDVIDIDPLVLVE